MHSKNEDQIDKNYFSSVSSNFFTVKNNYKQRNFNVTSTDTKTLNEELEQLSYAKEQLDLKAIEKLLDSNTRILIEDVSIHPWADNPCSVGALTATQLGIMASENSSQQTSVFSSLILETEILEKLVSFLKSDENDKREAALLTLSFISTSPEVVDKLLDLSTLDLFIGFLSSDKEGVRNTAGYCCRNLYASRKNVQKMFIAKGGSAKLVKLLESSESSVVMESVLNLLDLLLDQDDCIQQDVKKHLLNLGVYKSLESIIEKTEFYSEETVSEVSKLKELFI